MGHATQLLGDLDGDQIPEVAMSALMSADKIERGITILSSRSGAVLRSHRMEAVDKCLESAAEFRVVGLEDLNGDGVCEYAYVGVQALGGGCISVRDGANGAALGLIRSPPSESLGAGFGATLVCVNDADADGWADLLVANPTEVNDSGVVGAVFLVSSRSGKVLASAFGEKDMADLGTLLLSARDKRGKRLPLAIATEGSRLRALHLLK
jgi:hypothetical protein